MQAMELWAVSFSISAT